MRFSLLPLWLGTTALLLLPSVRLEAQSYPITAITISLPHNPDATTANWGSGMSSFSIAATTKLNEGQVDAAVAESKILITIKRNGDNVCGSYTSASAPATRFTAVTKVWSGTNAVALIGNGCTLPPGEYELSVRFFGPVNGKLIALSGEEQKAFTIRGTEQQTLQSPKALSPANGTRMSENDLLQPVAFRWTPVVPRPREGVTYRLKVWQLMQGQNGPQVMKSNQPIITKDVDNLTQVTISNLISGPCKPPYLCDFVWNVQALTRDGKPIGGNNGTSEAFKIIKPQSPEN